MQERPTPTRPPEQPPPRAPSGPAWRHHPLVRFGVPAVVIAAIAGAIVLLGGLPGQKTDGEQGSAELQAARLGALKDGVPQPGQPAPDFALRSLDGKVIRLSDLRGRPVLINFWATWCGPCRAEMPDLQAVYAERKDDFVVLAVNSEGTGADNARQLASDFRDELGLTFPIVLDTPDTEVLHQYKLKGLPDSFFIDRNGIIREMSIGPMNRDTILKKLKTTIDAGRGGQ
jgi:thiol-disulfide isomerase/thioredoxin